MISIKTKSDAHRLARIVSSAGFIIVMSVKALFYPPEVWLREALVTWAAAWLVCYPIMWFVGCKLYEIHELNLELQRLVSRDRLTDVATRDYFFEKIEEKPEAYGVSLMVDIDHFKKVNDTYGHLFGDKVISQVAAILRAEIRPKDLVCRFGGEEFVIFLCGSTPDEGRDIAERLRNKIAVCAIEGDGVALNVTVSIGGSLKTATEHIDDAIKRADEALYRAKRAGRNRIFMSPMRNAKNAA